METGSCDKDFLDYKKQGRQLCLGILDAEMQGKAMGFLWIFAVIDGYENILLASSLINYQQHIWKSVNSLGSPKRYHE